MVISDLIPEVKWRDRAGNEVPKEGEKSEGIFVEDERVIGRTTRLTIKFRSLVASQGGSYTCLSIIAVPSSIQVGTRDVIVKSEYWLVSQLYTLLTFDFYLSIIIPFAAVPPPTVRVVHQPDTAQLFTTDSLDLVCLSNVNLAVDIPVQVDMRWLGPLRLPVSNDSRVFVMGVEGAMLEHDSTLRFSSLRSTDSGSYTCTSTAIPAEASRYVTSSDSAAASSSVNAGLYGI